MKTNEHFKEILIGLYRFAVCVILSPLIGVVSMMGIIELFAFDGTPFVDKAEALLDKILLVK